MDQDISNRLCLLSFSVSSAPPLQSPSTPDLLYNHHSVAATVLNNNNNHLSEETRPLNGSDLARPPHPPLMGAPVGVGGDLGGQRLGAGVDGVPDGVAGAVAASGAERRAIERGGGGRGRGDCCRRIVPSSLAAKISKLNVRSGLYKLIGEFGLRENLYYGSIFLCMTLIVIVCFLVINNRSSDHLDGATAAMYDSGESQK